MTSSCSLRMAVAVIGRRVEAAAAYASASAGKQLRYALFVNGLSDKNELPAPYKLSG